MTDLKKFSIESGEQGGLILTSGSDGQIKTTKESLVDALVDFLVDFPDSDDIIQAIQEKKLAKKKEQYDKLQPAGFEHALDSVKKKREELKNSDNAEKIKWCQDNVSYNADHTMNILKLHKTFCEDISGQNKYFTFAQMQELEKTNAGGYKLMTDYNDTDADEIKHDSDWYKVINIFSNGNGDTKEGMELFRDMAGCGDRYWTATLYKNRKGKILSVVVCNRRLIKDHCSRNRSSRNTNNRVCGLKDMN